MSGSNDDEICRMPATELVARIGRRELSPLEVTDAVLARMDRLDPVLHAFCTPTPELAREQATRVGEKIARGEPVGPLAGVPVGVKDLIATKGIRTAMGSPAYRDFVPDEDDVAVERILAADAVILGKTNVPELGYSGVGHSPISATTRNPWHTEMTSGGSSAGSGAAVASGIGPVALGSDGGGSVRIPAAHCGIYGFKGSMGRIPLYPGCRDERYPGVSSWESLEHLGPMTRTVADAALMMSVLAGPDPRDRHSLPAGDVDWLGSVSGAPSLAGLRVAFSPDLGYLAVDPEVREIAARAATVFEKDLGCVVEEGHPGWENPFEAFWSLVVADTDLTGMRAMVDRYGSEMSPHLVDLVRGPWTAEQLTTAGMTRKAVVNRMWRFMADYDLFLTPTLAVPPFPVHMQGPEIIDGRFVATTSWLGFTYPINLTGQPAATVPAGFTSAGLPVGLQIIGRHLADGSVLRASAAFEAAAPWAHHWPALA
ncbi:MAG TPA: amidase family protein [Pseudonocardia sp.]|uniref:amidase n=1 Tax=Pseudonocardia sp. TaxID=60912 RepID=UPI002CB44F6F|nr:amidase family protein [Pseudonocardia sp.]HTF51250.1 amidase family protein [Pseudonocardia sp.]